MSIEKRLLTDFLQLYRECNCLWDNRQTLYLNKEARDNAYEILLKKYQEVEEDATIHDVKKKIEHMRATYRREHKKVLLSRLNTDEEEYVPQLWYYIHLTFLNEVSDFSRLETATKENLETSLGEEHEVFTAKAKIRPSLKIEKSNSKAKRRKVSAVFLPQQSEDDDDDDFSFPDETFPEENSMSVPVKESNSVTSMGMPVRAASEAEAFGTTVGLQLKEVDPMQRIIAEKLISDVIYQARLNKLTEDTVAVPYLDKVDSSRPY